MKRGTKLWLLMNLFAAGGTLFFASRCCWIEPELADIPGASGGVPFIWALSVLPVVLVFSLLNVGTLFWVGIRRRRKPSSGGIIVASGISLIVWVVSFVIDGVHHGI